MVDVSADTYIACQHIFPDLNDDEEAIQKKVLEKLQKSELVSMLGRLNGRPAPEPTPVGAPKKVDGVQEMTVDIRCGSIERRFLILYKATKNRQKLEFFVGCARTSRFERVQDQFREAFAGFKPK